MSKTSLPFSYAYGAHPDDERIGVKVEGSAMVGGKGLVLKFVSVITETEFDSKEKPKVQTYEVETPADEIKYVGIKRPSRLKDVFRSKPLTLYIDLKSIDSIKEVERFDCVLNFKGGQCRLYFDRSHEHLAASLKEEYRRRE